MNKIRPILILCICQFVFAIVCMGENISGASFALQVSQLAPEFNITQGEIKQEVMVTNVSATSQSCHVAFLDDPTFVNPNYFLGENIFAFPSDFQLSVGETQKVTLYLYNTDSLKEDGEYDALFKVDVSGGSEVSMQGVAKLYKGICSENLKLENATLQCNQKLTIEEQYKLCTLTPTSQGSVFKGELVNQGNIYALYVLTYQWMDSTGGVVESGTLQGALVRGEDQDVELVTDKPHITSLRYTLTVQNPISKVTSVIQTDEIKN